MVVTAYVVICVGAITTLTLLAFGRKSISYQVHYVATCFPAISALYAIVTLAMLPYLSTGIAFFLGVIFIHWFGTRKGVEKLPLHQPPVNTVVSRLMGLLFIAIMIVLDLSDFEALYVSYGTGIIAGFVLWPPAKLEAKPRARVSFIQPAP